MLSFFPGDVLDEIWDLIDLVSEGFLPTLLETCNAVQTCTEPVHKRMRIFLLISMQQNYLPLNDIHI